MIAVLYMHSLKMTEPAIIAQKVANVAIKTTKLWTWTQSHLETMLGHNGVLLTRFVSKNQKNNLKLCGVINIKHGWEVPYMGISMVKSLNMLN